MSIMLTACGSNFHLWRAEGKIEMGYIVRLDKPKDTPKGTHGWQVRGSKKNKKYQSRLFSDGVYGGQEQALAAAQAYLEEYHQKYPAESSLPKLYPYGFHEGERLSSNKSGVTGVYRTYEYGRWDTQKEHKRYYWGAFYTIDGEGRKHVRRHEKFYIEEWGETEARQRAIEFRQMWEEAAKQGVEAVKRFFDEYRAGWLA
jgi:hypothetical protein